MDKGTAIKDEKSKTILDRLQDGVVVGDGGYAIALEKRGYVKAGPYTPEAVIEHPDAVRQLHKEFIRAGSDVIQAFTFYSSDDKLHFGGNILGSEITCETIMREGCKIAREIADEYRVLVAGSISPNPAFQEGKGKGYIQSEIKKQTKSFKKHGTDFIMCEFFRSIVELEWTIEAAKKEGLPVAGTMCIGNYGDEAGVSPGDCGVRMARAGADMVGLNCLYDPFMTLETMLEMKKALKAENLNPFLMTQPYGCMTTGTKQMGYLECPEYPFAMESRTITRFDAQKYARAAYDLGIRFIGGCCGFEAYHIRAISEELSKERGFLPPASDKNEPWGRALNMSVFSCVRERANRGHWENLVPQSGRK